MRHCFILSAVFFTALFLSSCGEKKDKAPTTDNKKVENKNLKLYSHAMDIGDIQTAIFSLNQFLQEDSSNIRWYDTLAVLYINTNNFMPASWCAGKVLKQYPEDQRLLEVKAAAEQQLGRREETLEAYEALYKITGNSKYLYQTAAVEFASGNTARCKELIKQLLKNGDTIKDSIPIPYSESESQMVPIKAAVYNMNAYIQEREGQYMEAKKGYETAIKIFPDYVMAHQNLQHLMTGKR